MSDHVQGAGESPAASGLRMRDGTNAIERKAVYRAQLEIGSMPASLVVQIALWPDKLADWAKEAGVAPAVVYNMLAGVKPYHRVRTLLARRLNVSKAVLDHLVDAPRPEPRAKVPPDPPEVFVPSPGALTAAAAPADVLAPTVAAGARTRPPHRGEETAPSSRRPHRTSRRSRREAQSGASTQITLNI